MVQFEGGGWRYLIPKSKPFETPCLKISTILEISDYSWLWPRVWVISWRLEIIWLEKCLKQWPFGLQNYLDWINSFWNADFKLKCFASLMNSAPGRISRVYFETQLAGEFSMSQILLKLGVKWPLVKAFQLHCVPAWSEVVRFSTFAIILSLKCTLKLKWLENSQCLRSC